MELFLQQRSFEGIVSSIKLGVLSANHGIRFLVEWLVRRMALLFSRGDI